MKLKIVQLLCYRMIRNTGYLQFSVVFYSQRYMKSWRTKGEENRASTTRVLHMREFSNSRDSYPRARVRARIKFSSPQVVFVPALPRHLTNETKWPTNPPWQSEDERSQRCEKRAQIKKWKRILNSLSVATFRLIFRWKSTSFLSVDCWQQKLLSNSILFKKEKGIYLS